MVRTRFSRRGVLQILGATAVSLGAVAPRRLFGQGAKVSKDEAKYQNLPKDSQMCAVCANFVAPNSCQRVNGEISPQGWCTLFTPKPG